jgi:uncharacterized protein (TIGR02145 family)
MIVLAEVRVKLSKIFSFKIFGVPWGWMLLMMAFWYVVGAVVSGRLEISWKTPRNYAHCPEENIDDYHFQKLETFVDPRDSNEYVVLKYAEYKGCTMSEHDSGFVAGGDTVTFHLMLENLRYKTHCSFCLDSSCERGRYYSSIGRLNACPAGWKIASAEQNAGLFFLKGHLMYWPTFSPVKVVDRSDPSGLKRLRARLHEETYGWVDTVELDLSGFYNNEKDSMEFVDSLSVVWTGDGFPTVIVPNHYTKEQQNEIKETLRGILLKQDYYYPIRCIRIDDPNHKMDSQESNMTTFYNNMRQLPYLYR